MSIKKYKERIFQFLGADTMSLYIVMWFLLDFQPPISPQNGHFSPQNEQNSPQNSPHQPPKFFLKLAPKSKKIFSKFKANF